MTMQLRKAERRKAKLRIGLSGPAGSGKTYSALLLASGLASWDKIALIDTENGSGDLYSDLGAYNVITLKDNFAPEEYIKAIQACEQAGMEVIVIDSASHEWEGRGGCLEMNERIANTKFKGNTWAAWSETTPRHQKFIEAIVTSQAHVITTARSKTDTIQADGKIKKVGIKDIQREGFEYELTVAFNIDRDKHFAIASKDRTSLFIERDPFIIDAKVGHILLDWANSGVEAPVPAVTPKAAVIEPPKATDPIANALGLSPEAIASAPKAASSLTACITCAAIITDKVLSYSKGKFGKALCFDCQKIAAAGAH